MSRIDEVYDAIAKESTNRREKLWEMQRDRARELHRKDPEMTLRDIARRLGVREHSVAKWVKETRDGEKK